MASPPPIPIQIHIPPSLQHLAIPLSTFLSSNKQYTNLAVSSFIFFASSSTSPARLLLVHRAATERGFPNKWETPGGSCEVSDPTILHSLARETFEETGLRLTRFRRQIGTGVEFVTGRGKGAGAGKKKWCKLSFEIEVAEMEACGRAENVAAMQDAVDGGGEIEGVNVTLDPAEHQAYAWVTEKEIREDKYALIDKEQKELMLEAFTLRKADGQVSKALSAGDTSAEPSQKGLSE